MLNFFPFFFEFDLITVAAFYSDSVYFSGLIWLR